MVVLHIVQLKFKEELSASEVSTLFKEILELEHKSVHPESKAPYVKSHGGGINNSPEGKTGGLTHAFVFEFQSEKDRDYYLNEDPAHLAIVAKLKPAVADLRIFDFTPGSV